MGNVHSEARRLNTVSHICPKMVSSSLKKKYFECRRGKEREWQFFSFYFKDQFYRSLPVMLSCGRKFAGAEWNKIWLSQKDVSRIQSVCLFVRVKVLTLSLRVAVTWCCLDSSLCLLLPPLETCLCSHPSILFTAPLHPYRTNDHGSGQLLNAVVSSVLFSDSSSIALDGTQMYLPHTSPPHLADRLMWFWNTSVKVY